MQVAEIDVHDDEQVRVFWAAGKEADGFGRPYAAYRSLEATRVALRNPTIFSDVLALAATEDGQVLGIAEVRAPKLDNTHLAFLEVLVRPGHRGRGVGKALLYAQVMEADKSGMWTLQTSIFPENRASLALHHSAGYRTLAVRTRIAQLDGVWRDTVLLERRSEVN